MTQKYKFPNGFLWGAATAAHQIEGINTNSDWWAWENSAKRANQLISKGKNPEDYKSGIACDSYNRFDEDFDLARQLGHNSTRLSIEWARIEPKEGIFDEKAFEHYEKVLQSAKSHGLKTFVTLHHYTNPIWFANKGAFEKKENIKYFVRYAEAATRRLHQYADFWMTVNEPILYAVQGYWQGVFTPQARSFRLAWKVFDNMIAAHNMSAVFIRDHLKQPVSLALNFFHFQPSGWLSKFTARLLDYAGNRYALRRTLDSCDFISVNYYFQELVGPLGIKKRGLSPNEQTDRGWDIRPEGIEPVLLSLKKCNKPIYITENGLADAKDTKREKFIKDHLKYIHRSISQGVDVKG